MKRRRVLAACFVSLAAFVVWAGCSSSSPAGPTPHPLAPEELALRQRLGVPREAKKVVVLAQNSHLDIDWQKTFDDYYTSYVSDIFVDARKLMESQPRAYYSIAEMAFLEHHLAVHPEELAPLRAAAARGALHVVGGGMTSPDTLLPETELLMRDFLYGTQFAEDTLGTRPRAAWLPDSFGHGATVPDVLTAAGLSSVAFSRIDGGYGLFEQLFKHQVDPKPGSTQEYLKNSGSADFYWRGAGGARVLAHFMAAPGLYCAGDNIDYNETLQIPGGHTSVFRGDDTAFTDSQIDGYVESLKAWTKTPYMLVPIGCDFQHPKDRLIEYADGYNQRRYPTTGVWAVAAPFDTYSDLVANWGDVLPEVQGDLAPYYMGFYGTRAELKRATRDAARPFFVAETFATALGTEGALITQAAAPALRKLTRADHHDFIPGTASDAVFATEQMPLLAEALAAGQSEMRQVALTIAQRIPLHDASIQRALAFNASSATRTEVAEATIPITIGIMPQIQAFVGTNPVAVEVVDPIGATDTTAKVRVALVDMPPFSWRAIDFVAGSVPVPSLVSLQLFDAQGNSTAAATATRVVLSNAHVRAEWKKHGAFALTSLMIDGAEALAGGSFVVHDYHDTGGLWRTGNEMKGCVLDPLPDSVDPETLEILQNSALSVRVAFHSPTAVREAALGAGENGLALAITTGAAEATTRTVSFAFATPAEAQLRTSLPAGFSIHPRERVYTPTFWSAVGWAESGGWAVLLRQSTGVRMSTAGNLELMAVRDARSEQCDVEGGEGTDTGKHRIEWRIEHAIRPALAEIAAQAFNRPIDVQTTGIAQAPLRDLLAETQLVSVQGDGIVSAIKPAERGAGIILRALLLPGPLQIQPTAALTGTNYTLVDVAERDLRPLGLRSAPLSLDPTQVGSIATIRLK